MYALIQKAIKKYQLEIPACPACFTVNPDEKFLRTVDITYEHIHDFMTADPSKIIMGYTIGKQDCHYCDLRKCIRNTIKICDMDYGCPYNPKEHLRRCNYPRLYKEGTDHANIVNKMTRKRGDDTYIFYGEYSFKVMLSDLYIFRVLSWTNLITASKYNGQYQLCCCGKEIAEGDKPCRWNPVTQGGSILDLITWNWPATNNATATFFKDVYETDKHLATCNLD